jgi:ribose/xylose/arabinose/galactoside ABC-type transport system permease subunit
MAAAEMQREVPAATVGEAAASPAAGRSLWRRIELADVIQRLSLSLFLVALLVYFGVRADRFATTNNAFIILSDIAVIGIVTIGQTLAIVSGGFDLSTSGVVPLGSILFAEFLNDGRSLVTALLLTLLIGAGVGLVNGVIITKLGINPLIATLGMLSIAAGTAASIANGVSIPFDDPNINVIGDNSVGNIANDVWIFLALIVIAALIMRFTIFGRSLYAIGGNREASWLAGIKVDRVTITVYVTSATLSALAGVILASQLLTGSTTVGTDSALTSIAAVVLGGGSLAGGVGTIAGSVIGVLVLGVFQNGLALMHVAPFYQQIATGVILLVAVAFSQLQQASVRRRAAVAWRRLRGRASRRGSPTDQYVTTNLTKETRT